MFDNNQMFSNGQVVTADGFSTNAAQVAKTGPDGVWIEIILPAAPTGTTPTLIVEVYAKDTDASWATTDTKVGVLNQIAGAAAGQVGRYFLKIVTDKQYVKVYYDVGGTTPSYTLTAGIGSGPQQDALV